MRAALDGEPFIGIVVLASTLAAGNCYELEVLPGELGALALPKLFICARDDYGMVVRDTLSMAELAPEPKSLILLDGYEHGTNLFWTEVGDELTRDLLGFLKSLR
jgi:pimeloyl-ACP methyl ester carboxylesterase